MQEIDFRAWLGMQKKKRGDDDPLDPASVDQYITDTRRVETYYDDLDELYTMDSLAGVLRELQYSAAAGQDR